MTAHKHAALMALAAQDAAEIEDWWTRWQCRWPGCDWEDTSPFTFHSECEYRRKPQMVTCTITYPEPCREPLRNGQEYWSVYLEHLVNRIWESTPHELALLAQGRIHLIRDNAEQHRLALLGDGA